MEKKHHPLVSVIVPFYNRESQVNRCLQSLLNQEYSDFEVLAIDDGSTDNTFNKLMEFSFKDKRIKCKKQSNMGRSVARNNGIKMSTGELITFVDSDDFVSSKYLTHLVDGIKSGVDISMVNMAMVDSSGKLMSSMNNYSNSFSVMSPKEGITKVLCQNPDSAVWGKIFKKRLFDNVEFPEGKIYEDLYTTFALMCQSSGISFFDVPDYFYVQNDNGTIKGEFSPKKLDVISMGEKARTVILKKYPDLEFDISCRLFAAYSNVWMQISRKEYRDEYELLWKEIKKYRSKILFKNINNNNVKYGVIISLFGRRFFKIIYQIIK